MPKKLILDEVKKRIPPYVEIYENTYRGARYKCQFKDIEYNEDFEAIPHSVMSLQYGCKSRSNDRKSKAIPQHHAPGKIVPIEVIKSKLPNYIQIEESSYRGTRHKAWFLDTELNVRFEMLVCNAVRHGTTMCQKRKAAYFKTKFNLSVPEVKSRLLKMYGDRVKILCDDDQIIYSNKTYPFLVDGCRKIIALTNVLNQRHFLRKELEILKSYTFVRDQYQCVKCHSNNNIECHHIEKWFDKIERRFDLNNTVTLCERCHDIEDQTNSLSAPPDINVPLVITKMLEVHPFKRELGY